MNKDVAEKTKVAATSKLATLRNKRKRHIAEEHENEEEDVVEEDIKDRVAIPFALGYAAGAEFAARRKAKKDVETDENLSDGNNDTFFEQPERKRLRRASEANDVSVSSHTLLHVIRLLPTRSELERRLKRLDDLPKHSRYACERRKMIHRALELFDRCTNARRKLKEAKESRQKPTTKGDDLSEEDGKELLRLIRQLSITM
eukprot:g1294.t1